CQFERAERRRFGELDRGAFARGTPQLFAVEPVLSQSVGREARVCSRKRDRRRIIVERLLPGGARGDEGCRLSLCFLSVVKRAAVERNLGRRRLVPVALAESHDRSLLKGSVGLFAGQ